MPSDSITHSVKANCNNNKFLNNMVVIRDRQNQICCMSFVSFLGLMKMSCGTFSQILYTKEKLSDVLLSVPVSNIYFYAATREKN